MSKTKVFIFIDWYLPAYKAGGPVKSVFNIAKTFCDEIDFFIITSDRDFGDIKPYEQLKLNSWVSRPEANVIYLSPENQNANYYKKLIIEVSPDKIYFNSLLSKKFTIIPLKTIKKSKIFPQIILAPRGMLGEGALNQKKLKKQVFLRYARITGLFKGITWHASTSNEKQEILTHFTSSANVHIAENLGHLVESNLLQDHKKKEPGKLSLLFVSRISPKKNLLFLLQAMASSKYSNDISLTIIGPEEDKDYTDDCKKYAVEHHLSVDFAGAFTPIQLQDSYLNHDLFCLPTHHENYGHVILESLNHGTPILISENTPWRNLEASHIGLDLPLEIAKFSLALDLFTMMDSKTWETYSVHAHNYAANNINTPDIVSSNKSLFLSH